LSLYPSVTPVFSFETAEPIFRVRTDRGKSWNSIVQNSRPWKVLEKGIGPEISWKVLEL